MERSTIASCFCLRLGATRAACVAHPVCFGPVPLSLPLEVFVRILRMLQGLIASHLSYHTRFFFLPCLHPCTVPHTCTGSQWNSNVRDRTTIAFCLCLCLGATLPTCVGCFVCCHFSLLTLPLEPFYACYVETRPGGQEQRSQWHGQQHCLAQKT